MNKGIIIFLTELWNNVQIYNKNNLNNKHIYFLYYKNQDFYLYSKVENDYIFYKEPVKNHLLNFNEELDIENDNDIYIIKDLEELIYFHKDSKEIKNFDTLSFITFLLENIENSQKIFIIKQIPNLVYPYGHAWRNNSVYIEHFAKHLPYSIFKFLLKNLPKNIIKINNYNNNINYFFKIFEKNFSREERDELLFNIIKQKKNTLLNNKKQQTFIRDFLLEHYSNNTNENKKQLKQYSEIFPFIFYSINKEDSKDYLEQRKNIDFLYIEINCLKMISYNAIPKWGLEQYVSVIKMLFKHIEKNYQNIQSVNLFTEKENKEDYICINVYQTKSERLSQKEIENIIFNFLDSLKNNFPKKFLHTKDKAYYIETWLEHYKLKTELNKKNDKENTIKRKNKI